MSQPKPAVDDLAATLARTLEAHTAGDPNYWNFDDAAKRTGAHALFQYPAMMVPELQRALLEDVMAVDPTVTRVYDPFMGSGTVMLEAMRLGLDFYGSDINPMAVLLTHVKANPPAAGRAAELVTNVVRAATATVEASKHEFTYRDKWFSPTIGAGLDKIRSAITGIPDLNDRRFLWVCFAETTRLISNSRTSTVKLHSYPDEQIEARSKIDPIKSFTAVATRNAAHVEEHWIDFDDRHQPNVTLVRSDVNAPWGAPSGVDVVMTSPPYGDNQSTVTYGQHSFLPLRWIPHSDLVGSFEDALVSSTHSIDTLSLGGSRRHALTRRDSLVEASEVLAKFLPLLENRTDLEKKVLAFFYDYRLAISSISERLRPGGLIFWTLGQRRVGGHEVPLVQVTSDFLQAVGHTPISLIERTLPLKRKRMATRNRQTTLMATETILVTQKRTTSAE